MKKKHPAGPRFDGIYIHATKTRSRERVDERTWRALLFHPDGSLLAGIRSAAPSDQIDWPGSMNEVFGGSCLQGNWSFDGGLVHYRIRMLPGYRSAVGEFTNVWLDSNSFCHIDGRRLFTRLRFVELKGDLGKYFNILRAPVDETVVRQFRHIEGTPVWPPPHPLLAYLKGDRSVGLAVEAGEGESHAITIPADDWIVIAQGFLRDLPGAEHLHEGTRCRMIWRFNGRKIGSLQVIHHSARDGERIGYEGDIIHARLVTEG